MSRGGSSSSSSTTQNFNTSSNVQTGDESTVLSNVEAGNIVVNDLSADIADEALVTAQQGFDLAEAINTEALNTVEDISADAFSASTELGTDALNVASDLGQDAFDLADSLNTTSANLALGLTEEGFDLAGDLASQSFDASTDLAGDAFTLADNLSQSVLEGAGSVLETNAETFALATDSISRNASQAIDSAVESARSESENTNIKLIQTVGIVAGIFLVTQIFKKG